MIFQDAVRTVLPVCSGQKRVRSFIAGEWVWGYGNEYVSIVNPATEERLAIVCDVASCELDAAFSAARDAQEHWYFEVTQEEKERVFRRVAALLEECRGPLAWVLIQEGGKLWKWADAEVQEAIDTVWHYHGEIGRMYGRQIPCQMPDKMAFTLRRPYGVILGITPWNFPLAVPSWKIFMALAGGNAIIVKGAEQTPTTLSLLCYLVERAMIDEFGATKARRLSSILQAIHGKGETVGAYALEHGAYDKVLFTGGSETGAIVAAAAGRRRKPVELELGGHGAMILLSDYPMDRAVDEAITANLGDSGQRCVSARAVFAVQGRADEFVARYWERARHVRIGNPANPDTAVGPLVSKEQMERAHGDIQRAVASGCLQCHGGSPFLGHDGLRIWYPNAAPEVWSKGYYFTPTVLRTESLANYAMQEEIFGPVLSVQSFSDSNREEAVWNAVKLVNASRYGLSNAILTNQLDLAMKAAERIKTGILYIGRGTTGAEVGKPFGGIKDSGFGREAFGLEEVTYEETVYIDYHGKPRMAQAGAEEGTLARLEAAKDEGKRVFA
ncbi:MAG: aldehyde dehydrogenase family protein [Patescibacteria group bacterium]|mgnify:CR=1 FL=1